LISGIAFLIKERADMKLSMEHPILDRMNTITDFIILNMVFLISCLPVITIGPAAAALYQITLREVRKEHGYLIRTFFQYFREMFLQGISAFLLFAGVLTVAAYALAFWHTFSTFMGTVAFMLTFMLTIAVLCALIYVFPLMARFQNRFLQTVKNSFLFAAANPGSTAVLLLLRVAAAGLLYLVPVMRIFMMVAGFSLMAYVDSLIFTRLFSPYEKVS